MAQGVRFDLGTHSDIEEIAFRFDGNVSAIARHYGVKRNTVYEYFKRHPEGKLIIDRVREYTDDDFLDMAEFVYKYHLTNYKTNPGLALRAAEKVIDKKGHKRGWCSNTEVQAQGNDKLLNTLIDGIKQQSNDIKQETDPSVQRSE